MLLGVLAWCSCSRGAKERGAKEDTTPNGVVVKVFKTSLPNHENERANFLTGAFFNKPEEEKFSKFTTENWSSNYTVFAKALVQKADDLKLDSASLRKDLDLILKDARDKLVYLPVGAYQTRLGDKPVWIITVKWEENPESWGKGAFTKGVDPPPPLIHIRAFAFDQETSERLAFATCN
jgi:hypothetical protein